MQGEVDPLLPSWIMQADFALIMGLSFLWKTNRKKKTRVDYLAILHSPINFCLMFIFMLTCYTLEVPWSSMRSSFRKTFWQFPLRPFANVTLTTASQHLGLVNHLFPPIQPRSPFVPCVCVHHLQQQHQLEHQSSRTVRWDNEAITPAGRFSQLAKVSSCFSCLGVHGIAFICLKCVLSFFVGNVPTLSRDQDRW